MQFSPNGKNMRDCSAKLTHVLPEQEGLWTCGAKVTGQNEYTEAPATKLTFIKPGINEENKI